MLEFQDGLVTTSVHDKKCFCFCSKPHIIDSHIHLLYYEKSILIGILTTPSSHICFQFTMPLFELCSSLRFARLDLWTPKDILTFRRQLGMLHAQSAPIETEGIASIYISKASLNKLFFEPYNNRLRVWHHRCSTP